MQMMTKIQHYLLMVLVQFMVMIIVQFMVMMKIIIQFLKNCSIHQHLKNCMIIMKQKMKIIHILIHLLQHLPVFKMNNHKINNHLKIFKIKNHKIIIFKINNNHTDYNFQDQQTHKELTSKVNKENDEQLKALYEEYKALYKEVGADAYNIPKENLRTIRSREKFKTEIEKLKLIQLNQEEVKENELTASEKKTNEIKNTISSNKNKRNEKNQANEETFKNLYKIYKDEGGVNNEDDYFDHNNKTYDKKSIKDIKENIEELKMRKLVLKKKKKVPLINFLNEFGIKYDITGNETIEELKQKIEELEI